MFRIDIHLLTGKFVGSEFNDRTTPEWPPHPTRLFAALVSAWAAPPNTSDGEAGALRWLENCRPPTIRASRNVAQRTPVQHFVPDNDVHAATEHTRTYQRVEDLRRELASASKDDLRLKVAGKLDSERRAATERAFKGKATLALLPDERSKQARSYPTVVPHCSTISYVWQEEISEPTSAALDAVCARVHRLGHSSSLVSCVLRVNENADEGVDVLDRFEPVSTDNGRPIRVPSNGMFDRFVSDFEVHQGSEPRTLPTKSMRYDWIAERRLPVRSNLAGTFLVAQFGSYDDGRKVRPSASSGPSLAGALKGALLSAGRTPHPALSGHIAGDRPSPPSQTPHVAFVPLPWVGPHSDGRLLGVGVLIPDSLDAEARVAAMSALANFLTQPEPALTARRQRFPVSLAADELPATLRIATWSRESRVWSSVTPIVLDRYTKSRFSDGSSALDEAAEIVAKSCAYLGLPEPSSVTTSLQPLVVGSRHVREYGKFEVGSYSRPAVHATVTWSDPIVGPVILGAGRFVGLGLMLPTGDKL